MSRRPYVIGVTGNIASGKSLVLDFLRDLGAETIDADRVYHNLIEPGAPLLVALRERFGDAIVRPDGTLDRQALGRVVFADPGALADLDALTHPAVVAKIRDLIAESEATTVAVDAVKLIESGLDRDCDAMWIVVCDSQIAIGRLMERNGLSRAEALARIAAQPPIAPKFASAEVVIDNGGTRDATRSQVERAWASRPKQRS